ncbi:mitochondrial carrier domain-containing protein [Podospora didyma]|uniref:Mitochondrial carrier domain-containing protein n=1 Tax=Podospora didyma TaxID=330526 RepID=A0AAE0NX87_9PEZI|nr:mitochondrial carrier domain-containing protein [Podospora didyma]
MSRDSTHTEIVVAGAFAAFTVDLLIYPLDTIKTRYQSQDFQNAFVQSVSTKRAPTAFKGLYQGIGSVIFATLPAAGVFFMTYESMKPALGSVLPAEIPQPTIHALASATAELASCLVLTPAEVIKQNAQMLPQSRRSTSTEALRMLWRSPEGPARRLLTGYTALAARNLPFTAMQFPLFEFFRRHIWAYLEQTRDTSTTTQGASQYLIGREAKYAPSNDAITMTQHLVEAALVTGASSAVSGALAAFATTPTDVVKTRMMVMSGDKAGSAGSNGKSGLEVAKAVFRERGVRGLFRGAVLRAGWTALGSGLYLSSYEVAKIWLKGGSSSTKDDTI